VIRRPPLYAVGAFCYLQTKLSTPHPRHPPKHHWGPYGYLGLERSPQHLVVWPRGPGAGVMGWCVLQVHRSPTSRVVHSMALVPPLAGGAARTEPQQGLGVNKSRFCTV
jgi:hypothetical protein